MNRKQQGSSSAAPEASALIAALALAPHPEGGWFRETWRGPTSHGRANATTILYLLEAGQRSHWHRVDADETWFWHAGAALDLGIAADEASPPTWQRLGAAVLAGELPQVLVPAGHWQAAEAREGWALVGCGVVPGFDFAGFTLAPAGWSPGQASLQGGGRPLPSS